MEKVKVECLECGRKFSTASMLPTCPKCGGSDIDLRQITLTPRIAWLKVHNVCVVQSRRGWARAEIDQAIADARRGIQYPQQPRA